MKLKPLQNLTNFPLLTMKPLSTTKVSTLQIPSEMQLYLLSANLLYQAKRIIDEEINCKSGLTVEMYITKAISITNSASEYETKCLDNKEFKIIKKRFGLNCLYK